MSNSSHWTAERQKKLIENVTFSYQTCLWPQSCSIHTCHRGCGCWPRMLPIDFWFLSASFLSVYLCMHVYSPFYTRQTGVSMLCVHVHSCLHLHPLPCTDSLHSSILFHLISLTHALFMIYRRVLSFMPLPWFSQLLTLFMFITGFIVLSFILVCLSCWHIRYTPTSLLFSISLSIVTSAYPAIITLLSKATSGTIKS